MHQLTHSVRRADNADEEVLNGFPETSNDSPTNGDPLITSFTPGPDINKQTQDTLSHQYGSDSSAEVAEKVSSQPRNLP